MILTIKVHYGYAQSKVRSSVSETSENLAQSLLINTGNMNKFLKVSRDWANKFTVLLQVI